VHGANATLGPYGPYRDWPPKADGEDAEAAAPNGLVRDVADAAQDIQDPVTGETLAPLQHEEQVPNSATDPPSEV
jgi:hypothetical protein